MSIRTTNIRKPLKRLLVPLLLSKNLFLKVKSFIILHFKLYFIYMRQSLNYYIILEISFPYFRNDFKCCLFGQRFFFSIFIDLFCQFIIKLAKEPEKSTSIFLQPSGKMTRSPALKVSSLLQLARTSNKRRLPEPVPRTDSVGMNRLILIELYYFRVLLFLYSPSKVQQYFETCKKTGEKVL